MSKSDKTETLEPEVEKASSAVALARLGRSLGFGGRAAPGDRPLAASQRRSVKRGAIIGALLPGLGLSYAAPWHVTAIATIAVVIGWKVLAWFSLMFAIPFVLVAAVVSGIYGALYTARYNQTGKRSNITGDSAQAKKLRF